MAYSIIIRMIILQNRPRRNVLVAADNGCMIVNRNDRDGNMVGQSQFILDHGNASTMEVYTCINLLKDVPEPVIFDVGANIGTWTTLMASWFLDGKIHAFEPQHQVFQMLCGNCALNNLFNVHAHNIALSHTSGSMRVAQPDYSVPQDFGKFSLMHQQRLSTTTESMIIQVETLDSMVQKHELSRVDLIKIDAEGMDVEVLQGATETLQRWHPHIFLEHHDTDQSRIEEIRALLEPMQYDIDLMSRDLVAVYRG